jgi:hypothetical protein
MRVMNGRNVAFVRSLEPPAPAGIQDYLTFLAFAQALRVVKRGEIEFAAFRSPPGGTITTHADRFYSPPCKIGSAREAIAKRDGSAYTARAPIHRAGACASLSAR